MIACYDSAENGFTLMRLIASRAHTLHAVRPHGCHGMHFPSICGPLKKGIRKMWKYLLAVFSVIAAPAAFAAPEHAPWSYDGTDDGQDNWQYLSPEYETCGKGTAQSPVVISETTLADLPKLEFAYRKSPVLLTLSLYTIVTSSGEKLKLTVGGKEYTLRRMLMRSASEHYIGAKYYPVELELQHEDALGNMLDLSIFVEPGGSEENAALKTILDTAAATHSDSATAELDWNALLPAQGGYYTYGGSIPYPPCTEGVKVVVMKKPIAVPIEQLRALTKKLGRNQRLPQPLYMRTVQQTKD